ncbi:glycosyltransferase [Hymenobacter sp. BT175]|uniref:glycosyltransferase n=1 Tax=Hymenobacter translucens TaxID=2886507 RepID=UPI001D0DF50A|nr:glycosyltransferase [Hymenobacter translucens]MCC2544943.1 glycosyltransferase [Hymenobacter translucens]
MAAPLFPAAPRRLVVLLASVLKPVDDTRMYEKFARTLAAEPGLEVHVAGRAAGSPPRAGLAGIGQHVLFRGSRLSLARLRAQLGYWQVLSRVQPDVVVVHAPELLPLTLLWQKLGRQRRFLYDVRENYALNIQTQQVYPAWVRGLLARFVRGLETFAAKRASQVLLAEQSYADELPFATAGRTVILENKYQPPPGNPTLVSSRPPLPGPGEPLRLLFSGTISELTGIREAVDFALALRTGWPGLELTIIGFCQQSATLAYLREAGARHASWLRIVGGEVLVPHDEIIREIGRSHAGLLPYRPHPSSWRCIPTKLYEYLASGLPVLIPENPLWQEITDRNEAGFPVAFGEELVVEPIIKRLAGRRFYPRGIPADALWSTEGRRLSAVFDQLR